MAAIKVRAWRKAALLTAVLGLLAVPPATAGDEAQGHGKYARLTAQWWQWIYGLPVSENPNVDPTGANAYNGQPNKKVFFLAGTFQSGTFERRITVPKGTPLFGPVINAQWDNIGVDDPLTVPELRDIVGGLIDSVDPEDVVLTLDGKPRPDLVDRITSPVFGYDLPAEGNVYQTLFGVDVSGRVKPAVSDGYWFYIPPLPAGEHTLTFSAAAGDFEVEVTYHITVAAAGRR
jgi:hypothetical protein